MLKVSNRVMGAMLQAAPITLDLPVQWLRNGMERRTVAVHSGYWIGSVPIGDEAFGRGHPFEYVCMRASRQITANDQLTPAAIRVGDAQVG